MNIVESQEIFNLFIQGKKLLLTNMHGGTELKYCYDNIKKMMTCEMEDIYTQEKTYYEWSKEDFIDLLNQWDYNKTIQDLQ